MHTHYKTNLLLTKLRLGNGRAITDSWVKNSAQYQARNKQIGIAYTEALFDNQAQQNALVQQSMGEKLAAQIRLMQANAANKAKGRQGKRAGQ